MSKTETAATLRVLAAAWVDFSKATTEEARHSARLVIDECDKALVRIVRRYGISLRRYQKRANKVLWQAETASPDWGYWYSTARQAADESNASDRVVRL